MSAMETEELDNWRTWNRIEKCNNQIKKESALYLLCKDFKMFCDMAV